jgi:TRAP-type C4-dicarboxylate transport system permease small subunit
VASEQSSLNASAPKPLRVLLDGIEWLGRLDGWLGAGCLAAMTLLILAEVVVRALSAVLPIPGHIPVAWEYGSYLMAASFTFGAAMTLRAGGHIRVNLLLTNARPGVRRALEIAAALVGFAFTAFLAYALIRFTLVSVERGTTATSSNTPLWIPQAFICVGLVLLALQFLSRVIQAVLGLPLEDHRVRPASSME